MNDRYFREELSYLVEQGREFARQHPDLASRLNLNDSRGRDPNVERLMEGFAFLTSRIRQRLDDDFPELVEGLLSLIWPHHGRPIPSFCLVEFSPASGQALTGLEIPLGAEIGSQPLSQQLRCRYRTCAPLTVLPISLDSVSAESLGSASRITLDFTVSPGADVASLATNPIRVQLYGELGVCHQLYELLLGKEADRRYLQGAKVQAKHKGGAYNLNLGPESIRPAGFESNESLLPTGEAALWSFNILLDYFLFQEKFQAFWLDGLKPLAGLEELSGFTVQFDFNHAWPTNLHLSKRELRLNCVPAANLFFSEGEPIRVDRHSSEYKVQVDTQNNEFYQVFSVDRVEGMALADGRRRRYQPFMAARKPLDGESENLEGPYYVLTRKSSPWEGLDVYMSFIDRLGEGELPSQETVSLSLTCSNGSYGVEPLPGQIDEPISGVPDALKVRNITQPVAPVFPDPGGKSLWNWLSHASLNYLDLASVNRLRMLLGLLDQRRDEANARRIQGVASAKMERVREIVMGSLLTGNKLTVGLDEDHFADLGDVQIFARALAAFVGVYASINSFVDLEVQLTGSGKSIHLGRKQGYSNSL